MRKWLVVGMFVFMAGQVSAQAPALDPDLVKAWKSIVAQHEVNVAEKAKALQATDAYKAFIAAQQARDKEKFGIMATAKAKAPGFTLDMTKWELVPEK